MSQLKIIAAVTAKQGMQDEVRKILESLTDCTRREKGNIAYHLHQDINNPAAFIIIEEWEGQDSIDFHNQTPHFKQFKSDIEGKFDFISINTVKQIR